MPEALVPAIAPFAHPERGRDEPNRDVEQIKQIHRGYDSR